MIMTTDIESPGEASVPASKKRKKRNGFTLVELMVVIFILGLLTTIVVINVLPSQDRAMVEKARADIATLGQALEMFRLDNLGYPSSSRLPLDNRTLPERRLYQEAAR